MSDKISLLMLSDYGTNMEGDIAGFPSDEAAKIVAEGKGTYRTAEGKHEAEVIAEATIEPESFEAFIHGLLPKASAGKVYGVLIAADVDSTEALATKSVDELVALPTIGEKTAEKLLEAIEPETPGQPQEEPVTE